MSHPVAYTTREAVLTEIPLKFLVQALDDDGDGDEDSGLLDSIIEKASVDIDGELEGRYPTPFTTPVPSRVQTATLYAVIETLYERRGKQPSERLAKKIESAHSRLMDVADGKTNLQLGGTDEPAIQVVTSPAGTFSPGGHLAF